MVGEVSHDRRFDLDLTDIIPLDGAVERLVSRMKRWLRLQELSNQEKKVALLCYDYPPGESRFLSAAFLDTLASLDSLLTALRRAGYQVPELSREELVKQLCPEEHANSGRYHWSGNGLLYAPDELAYSRELEAAWGTAPGEIMTEQGQYRIPGIQIGNVFIGVQPARTGASWEGDAHYHDQTCRPITSILLIISGYGRCFGPMSWFMWEPMALWSFYQAGQRPDMPVLGGPTAGGSAQPIPLLLRQRFGGDDRKTQI